MSIISIQVNIYIGFNMKETNSIFSKKFKYKNTVFLISFKSKK